MSDAILVSPARPEPDDPVECRAWPRFPCLLPGLCRPSAHAHAAGCWPAKAHDISTGGVSLIVNRRFEPGTSLVIEVHAPAGDSTCTLLGRVMRVANHGREFWLLGCALTRPLGDEDLRAWCPPRNRPGSPKRRPDDRPSAGMTSFSTASRTVEGLPAIGLVTPAENGTPMLSSSLLPIPGLP